MFIGSLALPLATASCLTLAGIALVQQPSGRLRSSFSIGMVALAAEALAGFILINTAERSWQHALWLQIVLAAGVLLLLPWGVFVVTLATAGGASRIRRRLAQTGTGLLLAVLMATVAAALSSGTSDPEGMFRTPTIGGTGTVAVLVQVLVTVGILAGLGSALRASRALERWRLKYLAVGLAAVFLGRFYLLSEVLLSQFLTPSHLVTAAAILVVSNVVIAAALRRKALAPADLTVSRQFLLCSMVVAALGVYLLAIGGMTWLAARLGVTDAFLWGSLVVFASAIAIAILLLSDDIRWRTKQLIGRHIYQSKYDYREQWAAFTRRLGSLVTLPELAPEILRAVTDAVGATKGALYLVVTADASYELAASVGVDGRLPGSLPAAVVPGPRQARDGPVGPGETTGDAALDGHHAELAKMDLVLPLAWQARPVALLMLGRERTGTPYSAEDLAFLGTVGQQAAGAIVTAQMSEAIARTREFETFHRLTSFVLHDIKNAVAALSLLTRNAMNHFDDPQFQRDAIKTLSRTVERMNGLIQKLGGAKDPGRFTLVDVDLPALVRKTVPPLLEGDHITVVADLDPVPPVLADVDALERVVENLVMNAVDAMHGEGHLTLSTHVEGDLVSCSIADTGRGMSPEFIRRSLFVPFQSTKEHGWGIGLFQARETLTALGGRIDVSSVPGRGTTVRLLLPPAFTGGPSAAPSSVTVAASSRG